MAVIKKPQVLPPTPLHKMIFRFILKLLKYPRQIAKRYAGYNGAIGEILMETGDPSIDRLRRRNSKLVNIFIYLPFFLGIAISFVMLYNNRQDFVFYFEKLFSPVYAKGIFSTIGAYWNKLFFMFTGLPINKNEFYPFLLGYLGSIIGAWLLSLNPAFREQEKIVHIFSTLGYIDSEGKPWKVTWTPNAIMIEAFNCDPYALTQNNRFWSSVNFPPTAPKVNRDNMNKFIVQRKYELPAELIFEIKGDDNV
jgi:hypothetical protein